MKGKSTTQRKHTYPAGCFRLFITNNNASTIKENDCKILPKKWGDDLIEIFIVYY